MIILTTTSEGVLLLCLLGTLPLSNCLGIPVLTVGIRRYTNEENRGFAFGLFYVVMNIGALIAGPLIDALTIIITMICKLVMAIQMGQKKMQM